MVSKKSVVDSFRRELKLKVFLILLFCLIVSGLTAIIFYHEAQQYEILIGREVEFNEWSRHVTFYHTKQETKDLVLEGVLGLNLPSGLLPTDCSGKNAPATEVCLKWKDVAEMRVTLDTVDEVNCYRITWEPSSQHYVPKDCFKIGSTQWLGGCSNSTVPLQHASFQDQPFVSGKMIGDGKLGSVIHPYWLVSSGASIVFPPDAEQPVFVGVNRTVSSDDRYICFTSRFTESPYKNYQGSFPGLNYSVCLASDLSKLHRTSIRSSAKPPSSRPPDEFFSRTFLSTWGAYKADVSEKTLLEFAAQATADGVGPGTLFVNDGWQDNYGDFKFNLTKFPNGSVFIQSLQSLGYAVHLEASSMCDIQSDCFYHGGRIDTFVIDAGDAAPGLLEYWRGPHSEKWYRGYASAIDVHAQGLEWLRTTLSDFDASSGVDGLGFNGGEVDRLPFHGNFHDRYVSPNVYTTGLNGLYTDLFAWTWVRAAYKSQHSSMFVLLSEFNSTWSRELNGLQAVVPTVLSLGIMGYPFIIADAAGGNNYPASSTNLPSHTMNLPSRELYLRWVQLNAFLPVMHLSILPSQYNDASVTSITKRYLAIHHSFVADHIKRAIDAAVTDMTPLIRPVWWTDPTNREAGSVTDEFLVGDDVLVAPVVTEGASTRDIYLPAGDWCDLTTSVCYTGPTWITSYSVSLQNIPYFERK